MNQQNNTCLSCKEVISGSNVFTKEGWEELSISGLCEVCFDNATFPLEEEFEAFKEADDFILKVVNDFDGCVLAGGALRTVVDASEDISDYDLFFTKAGVKDRLEELLINEYSGQVIFKCPKNELTTILIDGEFKVQLIQKRLYETLEDLVGSFDIHACCAAWDGTRFHKSKKFISSVLHKIISFNNIEYPAATMRRVSKYSGKGYILKGSDAVDFIQILHSIELTDENMVYYID